MIYYVNSIDCEICLGRNAAPRFSSLLPSWWRLNRHVRLDRAGLGGRGGDKFTPRLGFHQRLAIWKYGPLAQASRFVMRRKIGHRALCDLLSARISSS